MDKSSINTEDAKSWAFLAGGIGLILVGLWKRNWWSALLALAGMVLAFRGSRGSLPVADMLGDRMRSGQRGDEATRGGAINVEKRVTVNRSPQDLYTFWRNFENLPRFMRHLESVQVMDDRRSHWVAKAAGLSVEWDAEVVDEVENQHIGWRSLPNSQVQHAGSVHFHPARGGFGTEVRVSLRYEPPGGALGETAVRLLGDRPGEMIETDLRRLKEMMEAMEPQTRAGQTASRTSQS